MRPSNRRCGLNEDSYVDDDDDCHGYYDNDGTDDVFP